MFSLLNGIYDSYLAPSQLNLLVVGASDAGKTTLLERLKVTEIPTRPRTGTGGNHTVRERLGAEELPASLKDALVETGAMEGIRLRRRASTNTVTSSQNSLVGIGGNKNKAGAVADAGISITATNSNNTATPPSIATTTKTNTALVVTEKRSRFSICPAPERYARSSQDQDEDFIDEETERMLWGGGGGGSGGNHNNNNTICNDNNSNSMLLPDDHATDPPKRVQRHSKEFDMDTLDLITNGLDLKDLVLKKQNNIDNGQLQSSMPSLGMGDSYRALPVTHTALQPKAEPLPTFELSGYQQQQEQWGPPLHQPTPEEYNRKPKTKMLPLRMIRPTIGTNLAKIDMYGAKCHIFDVGGKLQDMWERYYDDCDAVIFCWKLGEDPDKPPREESDSDDDSDSEEDYNETIYKKQQEMLNAVRKSVPDDVPFLIMGHIFGNANAKIVDKMYNTDILLPWYHNPMTGFCCSSAKTGAGVQSAMEWLIPLAKRQQIERIASKKELDAMLEGQGKTI
mmetsp:Transcript_8854/g.19133  ORF Transcript_8854/g.19133 Transcript_8854/m.19133 type:complete len:510 (+) Transcript_8854:398-1927(+)